MSCGIGGQPSPLRFEILGAGIEAEKLSRRLQCALAGLGWSAPVAVHNDPLRALDLGASRDPALLADGVLFAQGLPQTEELEALLRARIGVAPTPSHQP